MSGVRINVNQRATVQLTPYGIKLWNDYIGPQWPDLQVPAHGLLTTQLWGLMHVFGHCFYIGAPQMPFVNNDLEILP